MDASSRYQLAPNDFYQSVLITGITGSGGSYLAEFISDLSPSTRIFGIARWHSTTSADNLANVSKYVSLHECDLTDPFSVFRILADLRPDCIFHLASHANVRASFENPIAVLRNNIESTTNIFESIRRLAVTDGYHPRVLMCSTSEVYGQVNPNLVPIRESCPLSASSPYAVSKITQDLLASTYGIAYDLDVVITRMFAYINPRRTDLFATSFALQVARIEYGLQSQLLHGNLKSIRTLIDVRDAMAAYVAATRFCEKGEAYNIGGTTSIEVGDFLELLISKARTKIPCKLDDRLVRPADVTLQIPDTSKFYSATSWKPKYSFEESVDFLLETCRSRVAREFRSA